jgi:hypothetical protein
LGPSDPPRCELARAAAQPPQVCRDYETLPTVQVAPHHHPLHLDSPLTPQQDRRLTLNISARHARGRRHGLRRVLLQQRHLQAHEADDEPQHQALREDQPIHTVEDNDEDELPHHHLHHRHQVLYHRNKHLTGTIH